MGLRRTTAPAVEPVTLAEAKAQTRADSDADDGLIAALIVTARTDCENRTGRTMITSGWTLTADSFDGLCELPMPPAVAVTSISYVDSDGVTQAFDPSAYRIDLTTDPARLEPVDEWPATADQIGAVTIVYTAGYGATADDVPGPLKDWIKLAVADLYKNRERSDEKPTIARDFVDSLLDHYRMWPR